MYLYSSLKKKQTPQDLLPLISIKVEVNKIPSSLEKKFHEQWDVQLCDTQTAAILRAAILEYQ